MVTANTHIKAVFMHVKVFHLHFDSHFVSCSYEGEFCRHFGFFHLNFLVGNFYFWLTMLTEINHTIVNVFCGILIVTVIYIYKNDGHLVFEGQIKIIYFQNTRKKVYNKNLSEIINCTFLSDKNIENTEIFLHFGSHFVFC